MGKALAPLLCWSEHQSSSEWNDNLVIYCSPTIVVSPCTFMTGSPLCEKTLALVRETVAACGCEVMERVCSAESWPENNATAFGQFRLSLWTARSFSKEKSHWPSQLAEGC